MVHVHQLALIGAPEFKISKAATMVPSLTCSLPVLRGMEPIRCQGTEIDPHTVEKRKSTQEPCVASPVGWHARVQTIDK